MSESSYLEAVFSQEQSQGIQQVNIAVAQMDKVTQLNAAAAELNSHAGALKMAVEDMMLLVEGSYNMPANVGGLPRRKPRQ